MLLVDYLRFPVEQWDAIRHGALLHDIGKLGIPDAILLKPGSLSAMERRMMEVHVTYGYNILSSITKARQTLDIVLYHHERWDGSGYPDHLQGEQIPLVARLFAVVDVYDALTSDRPYRTAWLPDRALAYLKEKAGIQFDPEMVKAFMEVARLHLDQ
jgi:HD-GYP domain-containing protein (c-di-GMP phosphodiesterase class II)